MTIRAAALIPALNEADTIGEVVAGIRPLVAEVLVIDDGSTDGTGERARYAGARVVRHDARQGKGAAVRHGLADLLQGDFTHLVLLDGDLQHVPAEAARLLAEASSTGADLVIGERRFVREETPASRYYANRIGSLLLSTFLGLHVGDSQSGFRVFRADMLRRLRLTATGYEIETEMLIKTRRLGGRMAGVPISAIYTGHPSKLRPIPDTTRTVILAFYYRLFARV